MQTVLDRRLVRLEYQMVDIGDLGRAGGFDLLDNKIESLNLSIVWVHAYDHARRVRAFVWPHALAHTPANLARSMQHALPEARQHGPDRL